MGKPLPGMEVRIANPDAEGIGEVAVRSKTVMSHYLDDPEMTAETIVDGWLMTGDLGRIDATGHLQLFGRKKNMIVTEEGKNIYPEDIETYFEGLAGEGVLRLRGELSLARAHDGGRDSLCWSFILSRASVRRREIVASIAERNRRLPNYKRVSGYLVWDARFSAHGVAESEARRTGGADSARPSSREAVVPL